MFLLNYIFVVACQTSLTRFIDIYVILFIVIYHVIVNVYANKLVVIVDMVIFYL